MSSGWAKGSLFQSAITEADGVSVNVGYLALFCLMLIVLTAIPVLVGLAVEHMILTPTHDLDLRSLGYAIAAVCGGFGSALAALGAFIYGDRRFPQPTQDHDHDDPQGPESQR